MLMDIFWSFLPFIATVLIWLSILTLVMIIISIPIFAVGWVIREIIRDIMEKHTIE